MSSEIAAFYSGKIFLITGGTGFMGICLVEKILRCCSDVSKIILIVRTKKGQDLSTRYKTYFDDPIFDKLKNDGNKTFQNKVQFIYGDITKKILGLASADIHFIINNVNIIVNAAATTKLTGELKAAIENNLASVERIICLAKQVKHLQAFIHVSTTFVSTKFDPCVLQEELISEENVDYKYLLKLAETESNETINKLCPKLLPKYVNTYILTKSAAEQLIMDQKGDLPLAVFRPAIVMSSVLEPAPGWTNSRAALYAYLIGIQLGIIRLFPKVLNGTIQIAPVDMCANCILAIGWETAINPATCKKVYNFSSNNCAVQTRKLFKMSSKYPIKKGIGNPGFIELDIRFDRTPGYLHLIHVLPAILYDRVLVLRGAEPKFEKYAEFCNSIIINTLFFVNTDFTFINKNLESLLKKLNPVDQRVFNFDIQSVNWDKSIKDMCLGIKKYLFTEEDILSKL